MARLEIDFLTDYDDQSLLAELRRIAKATDSNSVTKSQIKNIGRANYSTIVDRFGSLRKALQLAGLDVNRFTKATDKELLAFIVDLWQQVLEKEGRTPERRDLKAYGYPVSGDTVNRRFGGWRKALVRAHASAGSAESRFPETLRFFVQIRFRSCEDNNTRSIENISGTREGDLTLPERKAAESETHRLCATR